MQKFPFPGAPSPARGPGGSREGGDLESGAGMAVVECAVIDRGEAFRKALERSMETFGRRERVEVRFTYLTWSNAWYELVERIVHRAAPDVMEIGSTWALTFCAMEALRPFTSAEIRAIGGLDRYLLPLWQTARIDEAIWGVPWLADLRLVFYRKDALEKAGIEERSFRFLKDPTDFEGALHSLARVGDLLAWVVPTQAERNTIHHIASWVWSYGGSFVSPDGELRFAEGPSMQGILAYFRLGPLMGCPIPLLSAVEADQVFWQGRAAATIGGWWLWHYAEEDLRARIGLALPPGPPFLGGSLLVVWQESRSPEAAFAVLRSLVRSETMLALCRAPGMPLPAQPDLLPDLFSTMPESEVEVLRTGFYYANSFPNFSLWGILEDRLNRVFGQIWRDLLPCPENAEEIIRGHLRNAKAALSRIIPRPNARAG